MRHTSFLIVLFSGICFVCISCGKHFYVLNTREINTYAKNAKEPGLQCFVEYKNGDTIKGTYLVRKHNHLKERDRWLMDDKEIAVDNVITYQDKYGYRRGNYSRLLKGKISLYLYQVNDSRLVVTYSESAKMFGSKMTGGTHTTFYIEIDGRIESITLHSLLERLKPCKPALNQVEEEFKNTVWKKNPDYEINDYRALIRIITVYNNCSY